MKAKHDQNIRWGVRAERQKKCLVKRKKSQTKKINRFLAFRSYCFPDHPLQSIGIVVSAQNIMNSRKAVGQSGTKYLQPAKRVEKRVQIQACDVDICQDFLHFGPGVCLIERLGI